MKNRPIELERQVLQTLCQRWRDESLGESAMRSHIALRARSRAAPAPASHTFFNIVFTKGLQIIGYRSTNSPIYSLASGRGVGLERKGTTMAVRQSPTKGKTRLATMSNAAPPQRVTWLTSDDGMTVCRRDRHSRLYSGLPLRRTSV